MNGINLHFTHYENCTQCYNSESFVVPDVGNIFGIPVILVMYLKIPNADFQIHRWTYSTVFHYESVHLVTTKCREWLCCTTTMKIWVTSHLKMKKIGLNCRVIRDIINSYLHVKICLKIPPYWDIISAIVNDLSQFKILFEFMNWTLTENQGYRYLVFTKLQKYDSNIAAVIRNPLKSFKWISSENKINRTRMGILKICRDHKIIITTV